MINIAALALLLSSLAAAGVWSPAPNPTSDPRHVIREGHRLIVVEYERQVPIDSPPPSPPQQITNAHRFQEASNLLPNVGQGISMPESPAVEKPAHSAKEMICDAYGSCKEKISNMFHKGNDRISKTASDINEGAKDAVERSKEMAYDVKESAKDAVESGMKKASAMEETARDAVKDKIESTKDAAKAKVAGAKDAMKDKMESTRDVVTTAAEGAKDAMKDKVESTKDAVTSTTKGAKDAMKDKMQSTKDVVTTAAEGAKDAVRDKIESTKEAARMKVDDAKDSVKGKIESTKDAIKTTAEGAKDAARNAMETSRDAGADLAGNMSHVAGQAANKAEEAADLIRQNLTGIASRARDAASNAAKKYGGVAESARAAASIAHLLAFATAYGTCVWVTFVSSHVLAAALPRQQFGLVQSKLYPVYFRAIVYSIGIACLGHFFANKRLVGAERVQGYNLMAALGLVLVNMLYLEPKATKVMFERMKIEKEEGRGRDMADVLGEPVMTTSTTTTTTAAATKQSAAAVGVTTTASTVGMDQGVMKGRLVKLNKKMKKLNTYSSFVNVLTLMSLTWHLVHLSRRLQMACVQ